jgi:hypothetical protein
MFVIVEPGAFEFAYLIVRRHQGPERSIDSVAASRRKSDFGRVLLHVSFSHRPFALN